MNIHEASLLMDALGSLAHVGLTKRGQDIQDRHAQAQQGYNNRHLDELIREHDQSNQLGQDRLDEEMTHHSNLEKQQQDHFAHTEAGEELKRALMDKKIKDSQLKNVVDWYADGVKRKAIPAAAANKGLAGIKASLTPEALAAVQASPYAAILSGEDVFQDVPDKATGNSATANMKDLAAQEGHWDQFMDAFNNDDDETATRQLDNFSTMQGINDRKVTGNVPMDSITTEYDESGALTKKRKLNHIPAGGLGRQAAPQPAASSPAGSSPDWEAFLKLKGAIKK